MTNRIIENLRERFNAARTHAELLNVCAMMDHSLPPKAQLGLIDDILAAKKRLGIRRLDGAA